MAIITSTVRVGQKPPKDVLKRINQIAKLTRKQPDEYDPDCPPSSPEALEEFAAMARERKKNRRNPAPVIAMRIKPDCLEKYKALGKGYTGTMADVLSYVADNPEIFKSAISAITK